jgi:hypothetical protein
MVLTRKYFYILLLLGISSHLTLTRLLAHGTLGTPPFSQLSYAGFLSSTSPLLLVALVLLCAAVFSEKENAVRKILFSAPITHAGYLNLKGAAIAAAFLLAAALPIVHSFAYFGWHFRFFRFDEFIHPILIFLLPSAVFIFGLSMATGEISVKLVYGLLPIVFLLGALNLDLPVWVDLCANNFLLDYQKTLFRSLGSMEVVYHVPMSFLLSRCVLAISGVILFIFACRKTSQ